MSFCNIYYNLLTKLCWCYDIDCIKPQIKKGNKVHHNKTYTIDNLDEIKIPSDWEDISSPRYK